MSAQIAAEVFPVGEHLLRSWTRAAGLRPPLRRF